MPFKTYRDESRIGYGHTRPEDGGATLEQINAGSLQRIADATEKMAASYDHMREDRDYWRRRAQDEAAACARLARSNAALRGAMKRLKRKEA